MKKIIRKFCLSLISLYTVNTADAQSKYIGCSPTRLFRPSQTQAWSPFSNHSALLLITNFDARAKILFHIMLRKFLLITGASFSFDILRFLAIYSLLVIETSSKRHGKVFGKKCQSTSDKLHSALYTFTVECTSHIKCTSAVMHCTLLYNLGKNRDKHL
jgi:hypothetical protein